MHINPIPTLPCDFRDKTMKLKVNNNTLESSVGGLEACHRVVGSLYDHPYSSNAACLERRGGFGEAHGTLLTRPPEPLPITQAERIPTWPYCSTSRSSRYYPPRQPTGIAPSHWPPTDS